MLDFLKETGISDDTIQELNKTYSKSILYNLSSNKINCIKIINYMKTIGIKTIENLLIERIDLFIMEKEKLKNLIEQCNIPNLIELINNDSAAIEIIFDNE